MIERAGSDPGRYTTLVHPSGVGIHPKLPILTSLGDQAFSIRVWSVERALLTGATQPTVHYTNAKVVLLGDSGVGKSGLSLVLTGQPFSATESTHGRRVSVLDEVELETEDRRHERREVLLWDMAGQAGYRLIHQLHLRSVAAAVVVFDARSEVDPLAGVRYWERALVQAERSDAGAISGLRKILVAARADRGGVGVSRARIEAIKKQHGFDHFIETSAKEGWNIDELKTLICDAVDWEQLPRIASNTLFETIKSFLRDEKKANRILATTDELFRVFLKSHPDAADGASLYPEFQTCVRLLESSDLIRRLSFGDLVLLQPELLDAYASALINAAKEEPDGLGSIAEEDARAGRFRMADSERVLNKEQEHLVLIATIEDLLRHELGLREYSEEGPYLVFPSQLTRENPEFTQSEGRALVFGFEGAVLNVYATLAVRLSHSGLFQGRELWRNASTYSTTTGAICGLALRETGEGHGELALFFDGQASQEMRQQFETYVKTHLERRALPGSVRRRQSFACGSCGVGITDAQVNARRERGFDWIECGVCSTRISLTDGAVTAQVLPGSPVGVMDESANAARDRQAAQSIIDGKRAVRDFDVFLCHNTADKPRVRKFAERMQERGILPWLDEWELRPGITWLKALESDIGKVKAAAVFVGKDGIGPWQDREIYTILQAFHRTDKPIIPVLLNGAPNAPELPLFLAGYGWVDFRKRVPDPWQQLTWGITGQR
jgi:small GTP-binding protein